MKSTILLLSLLLFSVLAPAQNANSQKGKFYIYWGYNWEAFSKSDISFSGDNYDFVLSDVHASDSPADFSFRKYFHPRNVSIPQFNLRGGYFFNDHWNISIGTDHMKYVVNGDQTARIDGKIDLEESKFNGTYSDEPIVLTREFMQFEHTDGLNYINAGIRRFDMLIDFNKVKLNLTEGFSIGGIMPRTNSTLLGKERHDEFHLAGYGLNAMVGLNVLFWNRVFLQSEVKGGFINMPDIRTTQFKSDMASQHFFFSEFIVVLGVSIGASK